MHVTTLISPQELSARIAAGNGFRLIDVRNFDEHQSVHVTGAECVPLGQLLTRASEWNLAEPVTLICHSGTRAAEAAQQLRQAGFTNVTCVEGGTKACRNGGVPVVRGRRRLPVLQQTQITIGLTIVAGLAASLVWPPAIALAWLGGAGLMVAGATGFCPMAKAVAAMPWNRSAGAESDSCSAGTCAQ